MDNTLAENAFGIFFCNKYGIDPKQEIDITYVDANTLLTSERLDLVAKILWLNSRESELQTDFFDRLYREHIKAITGRTEIEAGKEHEKNTLDAFEKAFEELRSVKNEALDFRRSVVPVSIDNIIMDGAHRTAASIVYGRPLPICKLEQNYPDTGAAFLSANLLGTKYIEYLVSQYCKYTTKNVYAICLWPKSRNKSMREKSEMMIAEACKIIYKKEIHLNYAGLRNLMVQIYYNHDWIGGIHNGFSGVEAKAKNCWEKSGSTVIYFVEGPELSKILSLKSQIRDLFNIENDSVHASDNNLETSQIADIVLNDNSLDLLMRGTPTKFKKINLLTEQLKNAILDNNKQLEDFVVDSSGILALYGLRDIGDLDYLGHEILTIDNEDIESNNDHLNYHMKTLDDLIYNPDNYLYYNGVKFITLDCAKVYKMNRGSKKDLFDIKLIDSLASDNINFSLLFSKIIFEKKREVLFIYRKMKDALKNNKVTGPLYMFIKKIIKG